MAASSAMYSSTFALPTAPKALSSSQQLFRSANHQPSAHHDHLQPSADSPAFTGAHMSGFVIGAVVALGSAMRHRKRKQKTSTLRFAAKVVATAPVAKKAVESTTDNTRDVRPSPELSRKLRPVVSDPDAPKMPCKPFIRYFIDFRKGAKAKGTHREILVAAGKSWKALSPDKRAQWEKPYEKEMKQYTTERQKYVNSGKRDAWYRDPARPKGATTPFFHFLAEQRNKYSDLAMMEQTKKVAEDWKALAPSKKTKYEKTYAKDKQAYDLALKKYKDSGKESEWLTKVGITAVREKVEAKRMKLKAVKEAEKKKAAELKAKIRQKTVAATMKEKAAKAKAKMTEKKTKAAVALKQLRTKRQVKQKLLVDKLKAVKAKKIAAEKKATGLQKVNLAAAKLKEKAAKATTKANGADKKTAAVAPVTRKAAKDKADVAPKEKLAVATQKKKKATSAQVEEGIKKKVVTAKLKAATVKAKAKPTAVKV